MEVELFLFFGLLTGSLGQVKDQEVDEAQHDNVYTPAFLIDLKSTDLTYELLSKSSFTYIIVDPDLIQVQADEVIQLRKEGKIMLAYLSVGEAEISRSYWQDDWVSGKLPRFIKEDSAVQSPGRWKVRFWMPEWQIILRKYMRSIARYGYSGVVLDSLDSYRYFQQQEQRLSAADDMIRLVSSLRQQQPDFLLFSTNAVELYQDDLYRRSIDGIVATSTWYQMDVPVDQRTTNSTLGFLRKARADTKTILACDFPEETQHVCDFYIKCTTEVFRCSVFDSRLNGAGESC